MKTIKTIGLIAVAAALLLALGAGAAAVAYAALQEDSPLAAAAASAVAALQGEVTTPGSAAELPADSAAAQVEPGLVIVRVLPDGPGAAAGLERGDILLEIEGVAVNTLPQLRDRLAEFSPGDSVGVTVMHGDERRILVVTLGGEEIPVLGVIPYADNPPRNVIPPASFEGAVLVVEVEAESPAAEAGLQAGDRIVSLNDETLDEPLPTALEAFAPGDTIALGIERDGELLELMVTLGTNPGDATRAYLGIRYRELRFRPFEPGDLPRFDHEGFGLLPAEPGAVIAEIMADGAADEAGLAVGDRITAVDGAAVETPQDLVDIITSHAPGDQVVLTVESADAEPRELTVTLGQNDEGQALLGITLMPGRPILPDFGDNCGEDGEQPCETPGFRLPFRLPDLDFSPFERLPDAGGQSA